MAKLFKVHTTENPDGIVLVNPNDYGMDYSLFLMTAGAYGWTKAYVFAKHLEDALEELVEYLDDHAPGELFWSRENLPEVLEERWPELSADERLAKFEECDDETKWAIQDECASDCYQVGHTTLNNGDCLSDWNYSEVSDAEYDEVVAACSPKHGWGMGRAGCLYDSQEDGFANEEDAVAAATLVLELSAADAMELRAKGIVYCAEDATPGCDYIELYEVSADEYESEDEPVLPYLKAVEK